MASRDDKLCYPVTFQGNALSFNLRNDSNVYLTPYSDIREKERVSCAQKLFLSKEIVMLKYIRICKTFYRRRKRSMNK